MQLIFHFKPVSDKKTVRKHTHLQHIQDILGQIAVRDNVWEKPNLCYICAEVNTTL